MFEQLRKFRKLSREIRKTHFAEVDEEGRNLVRICVADDRDFLSPFSGDGIPLLSADTAEFLEDRLKNLRSDASLHLCLEGSCIDAEERKMYDSAIRNYYHLEFLETERELRKNSVQSTVMTVFAALLFALALVLDSYGVRAVLLNMLDVVAWVFMWEAADLFFFRRSDMRLRRLRAFHLIQSRISFR